MPVPPYSGSFDAGPTLLGNLDAEWDIWYEDRNGRTSKRRITVRSLHGAKYPKYVRAWCHGRRDWRHFNLYNVRNAIDVETGEKVPVTRHLIDWLETH
ncbi:hypothetical protein [Minwuia thermotolerans]|uniref:WYL domain-containing protein n=1 Tax=Minwuia thermotolerans TaxID=2056226 RepID=A0A2M9G2L2_9PROT|nr:hypothetical protein [Minwuia thermotolerans]PJK29962.1 hypothetical protein CVT23_09350 [Minwuia thermotolerans]